MTKQELIEGIKAGRFGKDKTLGDVLWSRGVSYTKDEDFEKGNCSCDCCCGEVDETQIIEGFQFDKRDDLSNADYNDVIFRNCSFDESNLTKSVFLGVSFKNCSLDRTWSDQSVFQSIRFENSCLSSQSIRYAHFTNFWAEYSNFFCALKNADLQASYFNFCELRSFSLVDTCLSDVSFYYCKIFGGVKILRSSLFEVIFSSCSAPIDFDHSKLGNVTFRNCDLRGTIFNVCELENVKFVNCDLEGVRFLQTNLDTTFFENCSTNDIQIQEGRNFDRSTIFDKKISDLKKWK